MAGTDRLRFSALDGSEGPPGPPLALAPHGVDTPLRTRAVANDFELVREALGGERSAEEQLYRGHVRAVSAVAVMALGPGADAEDVVQDSFLTAFERLAQLREPAQFRAWIVRIAVRHVHRRFRRLRLLRVLGLDRGGDDAVLPRLVAAHVSTEMRVELTRIDARLRELAADLRVCWILRHVEGYELKEVAAACGVSLATVKRWLARSEAHVRAYTREEVGHG